MTQWGWNPETFMGVGTVVASTFGAFAFAVAARDYRRQRLADETSREAYARRAAELVLVEVIHDTAHPELWGPGPGDEVLWPKSPWERPAMSVDGRQVYVRLTNGATTPLSVASVVFTGEASAVRDSNTSRARMRMASGERYVRVGVLRNRIDSKESIVMRIPFGGGQTRLVDRLSGITIVDHDDRHWTIRFDGKLLRGELP